ncbi:MAG TPA: cysteine--tRNA ligase [Candidatus Babeliales bacterium]|nr:cysteine--tRNA ligase [Candidatus Babeliales bacterium]
MKLTNTLTGKKEDFTFNNPIKMYVCGVTPYDDAHIGHGRCYVSFDILIRVIRFFDGNLIYCRNFTDIDDKIMNRAEKEFGDRLRYREIADRYINNFNHDIDKLNCLRPDYEPRVTDAISQIIEFIQKLIDKGDAYQSGNDVYFCIEKFPDYGKLSKQKIESLYAGVRIDIEKEKKNPLDFALWKGEPDGEFWISPWGYGRPGWHIECSVLAHMYLGEHIDIHGGGLDLIFPHHENEIAQSETLFGAPFSHFWLHNGMVNSNKEKMSKSLGNFFILQDIFKYFDPMVVRYYFLMHHYRMPIEFSFEGLQNAQKSYERLIRLYNVDCSHINFSSYDSTIIDRILFFLSDDINVPGALGVIFENMTEIADNKNELAATKNILRTVLGLTLQQLPLQKIELTPQIEILINARNKARKEKNWIYADELREQLETLGITIQDEKI